jgi:hypothetical protein
MFLVVQMKYFDNSKFILGNPIGRDLNVPPAQTPHDQRTQRRTTLRRAEG